MATPTEDFWADDYDDPPSPGVDPDALAVWEKEHDVSLPVLLRELLLSRNGGRLRNSLVTLRPLEDFEFGERSQVENIFAAMLEEHTEPADVDVRKRLLTFADDGGGHALALDYRADDPLAEPPVVNPEWVGFNGDEPEVKHESVKAFADFVTRDDGEPPFNWSQLAASETLASIRHVIDLDRVAEDHADLELPLGYDIKEMLKGRIVTDWLVMPVAEGDDALTVYMRHTEEAYTVLFRHMLREPLAESSLKIKSEELADWFTLKLTFEAQDCPPLDVWTSNLGGAWQYERGSEEGPMKVQIRCTDWSALDGLTEELYQLPLFG